MVRPAALRRAGRRLSPSPKALSLLHETDLEVGAKIVNHDMEHSQKHSSPRPWPYQAVAVNEKEINEVI